MNDVQIIIKIEKQNAWSFRKIATNYHLSCIHLEIVNIPDEMPTWVSKCTLVRPVFAFLGTPPEWPILLACRYAGHSPPSAKIMSVQRLTNFSRLTYKTGAGKFIPVTTCNSLTIIAAQLFYNKYIAVVSSLIKILFYNSCLYHHVSQ